MKHTFQSTALVWIVVLGSWLLAACTLLQPDKSGAVETNSPVIPGTTQTAGALAAPSQTPPAVPGSAQTPEPTTSIPFEPISVSAPDCTYGGAFKTIEALDPLTVRFTLCQPDAAFLSKIAFPSFAVQPQEWLEQNGGGGQGSPLLELPVGTGPYRVQEWRAGEQLSLEAFDGYWGEGESSPNHLIFRWHPDASQRLLELQSGAVQGIDSPLSMDYQAIQDDPNLNLIFRPPLSVAYLGMNNTYPPFDNQLVRRAIAMALDRNELIQSAFPPGYQVASFFTPCAVPNGCVGEPWYDFDLQQARDLLSQAGFPDGFQTQLSYRNVARGFLARPRLAAENIQAQLARNLNIKVKLIPIDSNEFLEAVDEGLLPGLFLLGWGADYPDASNFLDPHFSAGATKMFGTPFADISEPLAQALLSADEQIRRPHYESANNAIRQHIPMIPLSHGAWALPESMAVAYHQSVEAAHANPFGFERFAQVSLLGKDALVWMQSAEPLSLYCADETDTESLRACAQITEPLYQFQASGAQVEPALAENCQPSGDLQVWTCTLRQGVRFHDGSLLDANDVAYSWIIQWDAAHPFHKGRTGEFAYFQALWGAFLNGPLQ